MAMTSILDEVRAQTLPGGEPSDLPEGTADSRIRGTSEQALAGLEDLVLVWGSALARGEG